MSEQIYKRGEFPKVRLATSQCSECGKPVEIRQNKNGGAYYRCMAVAADGEGWCGHQVQWGRVGTAKIKAAAGRVARDLSKPAANSNSAPLKEAANSNSAPEQERKTGGGFLGLS